MTTHSNAQPESNARRERAVAAQFFRDLLDGEPCPEVLPDMGEWTATGRALAQAYAYGKTGAVRDAFNILVRADRRLMPLVCNDPITYAASSRPTTVQSTSNAPASSTQTAPSAPTPSTQTASGAASRPVQAPATSSAATPSAQSSSSAPASSTSEFHARVEVSEVIAVGPICPTLPEVARLPELAGVDASAWLDGYVAFSRQWSPLAYDGFHEAIGLWLLSTIAARRVSLASGHIRYTPLFIALVAKTGLYAKSTTAEIGRDVLRAAHLDWLLAADDATPQKFISDLVGHLPANYGDLPEAEQQRVQRRLALAGQRGWYYEEFGQLLSGIARESAMADFRGILRRFDDCKPSFEYGTISRGSERVENPYLSLLASMTPADLKPMAKRGSSMWSDGFLSRFALITPPPREYRSMPLPQGERHVPEALVTPLVRWHERLGMPQVSIKSVKEKDEDDKGKKRYRVERGALPEQRCQMGHGVREAYQHYTDAIYSLVSQSRQQREDLDGSYIRLPERALRIAMLLASLENLGHIELRHWARAQDICERWRCDLHLLFGTLNEDGPSENELLEEKIVGIIERVGNPTAREIKRHIRGIDTEGIHLMAERLTGAGILEKVKSERTVRYHLLKP